MRYDSNSKFIIKSCIVAAIVAVITLVALAPPQAKASERPLLAQDHTINAASPVSNG